MATPLFSIGFASASVKLRPIAGLTPSVVKKSGEMRMISSCSVEPVSPTTSAVVPKDGKAREGRDVAAPLVVVGQRGAVILDAGFRIGVEDRDQPIGLRKRKRTEQDGIDHRENREVRSQADRDRGQRGDRERRSFAQLAKGEAKIVHEQTYSARKAATCSNADIAVYSLVIDAVLELTFVLGAVEMAFRFCDESVVVDLPKFVAADAKAFSRATRSGVRSS